MGWARWHRGHQGLQSASKLRVHSIDDQDSTGPWIREEFPGLFSSRATVLPGMYRGGDTDLVLSRFVEEQIHGHGPLGDLYPNYDGGDIWSRTLGRVRGIKEGDTPSFLYLIPNGLGDPQRPWLGSWGGRFEGAANRYADVPDRDLDTSGDPDPRMAPSIAGDRITRTTSSPGWTGAQALREGEPPAGCPHLWRAGAGRERR